MRKILPLLLSLLLLIAAGCRPQAVSPEAHRGEAGELLLYLKSLPPEAERLRFTLATVSAVREDGAAISLDLRLPEPMGKGAGEQRLLASGRIPEGAYRGFAFTVGSALLRTEEGDAALLVPKEPVFVAAPFVLARRGATLFEVSYRHEGSVRMQFEFVPSFSVYVPDQPVTARLGFASRPSAGLLLVFDRKTMRAAEVIAPGERPAGLALDQDLRRLYVALPEEDAVSIIDIVSGSELGRIQLQTGDRPERLALTRDGRLLLAANAGSDSASFLDPISMVELSRLAAGDEPRSVLIDREGRRAFVFNLRGNSISVLDLAQRRLITTLATDAGPYRGAFSRDGSRLYVIHRDSPFLTVLDTVNLTVLERLQVGLGVGAVLVDSRTDLIYLGRTDADRIEVYDPFSELPVDYLEPPGRVADLAIDDEENRLLVAAPREGGVAAIDLVSRREAARLDTGPGLHSVVLMGSRP